MTTVNDLSFGNFSNQTIQTGVYYRLKPEEGGDAYYFPVTTEVGLSLAHTWNEGDNYAKNVMQSVASGIGLGQVGGDLASRLLQKRFSGSPHVSAAAVYVDTAPPSINVATKLISVDGKGNVLKILDRLYKETSGSLGDITGGGAARGGFVTHPGWWVVEVVGGGSTLLKMKDMICTSINITMHSPWVDGGKEPCLTDLTIGFKHGFRGFDNSMDIGG